MPRTAVISALSSGLLLAAAPALAQPETTDALPPEQPVWEEAPPARADANPMPSAAPPPERSLRLGPPEEVEADLADREGVPGSDRRPVSRRVLHGFRLGYLHLMNYDKPLPSDDSECLDCQKSVKERYGLRSPHQFLIGYEIMGRMVGHDWLNVLIVGNVMASGIEQSKFLPSANFLIGFEFDESFQVGVGPNLTLEREKPAHMVIAGGWTPVVGSFHVPVHGFFIPDVDQNHRFGMTVGVNW
jgi:hypothetical protein